jgi:hypothetical protein
MIGCQKICNLAKQFICLIGRDRHRVVLIHGGIQFGLHHLDEVQILSCDPLAYVAE